MNSPGRWQSRALFISSTFEDMHAERDYLQQFVFPELEERLRAYQTHLSCVDLRWGVETTSVSDRAAKEAKVLKVCLAEIDRCRPYLVVLLGERYGWVPPLERAQAATKEVGLALDDAPCSVTALEIEYGALRTRKPMKPLFYFRQPLPYDAMSPDVVSRYSDKAKAPDDFRRLEDLKAKIRDRYQDRVREYSVEWQAAKSRPTGLEAFGKQVLEDLWSEFKQFIDSQPAEVADWRSEEAALLDAFIEDRCQVLCGRTDLIEQIIAESLGSHQAGKIPGKVIIAESGAGKSALFATVVRTLTQRNEAVVLAHSAGISPRSLSVNDMLRRWCALLAAFLEVEDECNTKLGADEIQSHFLRLLKEASRRKRIVVLVDALDQFERTSQAAFLTWLPRNEDWPENVVLIATGTRGTETGVLGTRGMQEVDLGALSLNEASAIAARICNNFHKTLPAAVQSALLDKRFSDGRRAAGNPLWLTLAVNELIVLDDDDFAQLPSYSGTAEERLVKLMVHVIGLIPPDLPGAYNYVYARVERTYGESFVRSLMTSLSLARFGLRERDLEALLPSASGIDWIPASFAAVRRVLRAHLCERGRSGQWAFTHHQARWAALDRYSATPEIAVSRHRDLATHLKSLPLGDLLRQETMYHLIKADAEQDAAGYWIEAEHDEELPAAFEILRQYVLSSERKDDTTRFPLSLLRTTYNQVTENDDAEVMALIAGQRLLEFTEKSRLGETAPMLLRELLNGMIDILRTRLRDYSRSAVARSFFIAHCRISDSWRPIFARLMLRYWR